MVVPQNQGHRQDGFQSPYYLEKRIGDLSDGGVFMFLVCLVIVEGFIIIIHHMQW